jgi:hypothetical protein
MDTYQTLREQWSQAVQDYSNGRGNVGTLLKYGADMAAALTAQEASPQPDLALADLLTRLLAVGPEFQRSSDGARMCFYCRHLWSYGNDDLRHADDCIYLAACRQEQP